MTDSGALKVDEFLQVEGQENVFAIGDVTDIDEEKMAYTAQQHARTLVGNLVAEVTKNPKTPYKPGKIRFAIALLANDHDRICVVSCGIVFVMV